MHEACLRLVDVEKAGRWDSRGHFFAAAAEAMRRILLNHARDKNRLKRGGERRRIDLDHVESARLRQGNRQNADEFRRLSWRVFATNGALRSRARSKTAMSDSKADAKAIFLETLYRTRATGLLSYLDRACGNEVASGQEALTLRREAQQFLGVQENNESDRGIKSRKRMPTDS